MDKQNTETSKNEDLNSPTTHKKNILNITSIRDSKKFYDSAPVAVDIGGSFTKLVYWRPPHPPDLPSYIIKEFQDQETDFPIKPDPSLKIFLSGPTMEGSLRFLKFPSSKTIQFIQFLLETNVHQQYGPDKTKVISATGGGAFKYADIVAKKLNITFNKEDEMSCLIRGLNFALANSDTEVFSYSWQDHVQKFISRDQEKRNDPKHPYPYLLVNVGSGVSILKVDNETTFERVSGSSVGGGTFWGLCKLLTNIKNWDDIRDYSKRGDNKNVDLMVGDIYGCDYDALGLKADVIASSFGKIATKYDEDDEQNKEHSQPGPQDIAKSLLFMLSNNIAQIGYLNAKQYNLKRIFFSGGFLQENEFVWSRFSYAVNFWSKGEMDALFLSHNSYLGALGALLSPK